MQAAQAGSGGAGVAELSEAEILAELLDSARLDFGAALPGGAWSMQAMADAGSAFPVNLHGLLERNGEEFVVHAFAELLGRVPDPDALAYYHPALVDARLTKIEILGLLRYSPEGNRMAKNVPGLRPRFLLQRSYRVPLAGRVLRLLSALLLLPRALRDLQRIEQAAHADRLRLEALEKAAAATGPGLAVRLAQVEAQVLEIGQIEDRLAKLEQPPESRA